MLHNRVDAMSERPRCSDSSWAVTGRVLLYVYTNTMPLRDHHIGGTASGQCAHRSLRGELRHLRLPDAALGQQLRAPVADQVRAVEVQASRLRVAWQWFVWIRCRGRAAGLM